MSLQKARKINVPYTVYPAHSGEVRVEIPRDDLLRLYRLLKTAEQPQVTFQEDQGAMFMDAFRLREKIIKEALQELERYV